MLSAGLVTAGQVLGHEFTGVVAGLGPGVTGWTAGDRVAVLPVVACGQCYACRAGRPNLCEEQGIDHGPGIGRQGGYAESVAVSELRAAATEQVKVLLAPGRPANSSQ
jgi:threonine dehydrogenase-like Zn-dependent dehydrogenase